MPIWRRDLYKHHLARRALPAPPEAVSRPHSMAPQTCSMSCAGALLVHEVTQPSVAGHRPLHAKLVCAAFAVALWAVRLEHPRAWPAPPRKRSRQEPVWHTLPAFPGASSRPRVLIYGQSTDL